MLAVLALTSSQTSTLSLASLDATSRDNSTRLFAPAELERSYRDDGCVSALERSFEAGLESSWHSFSGWRNAFGAPGDAVRVCASKTSSSQCPPGESLRRTTSVIDQLENDLLRSPSGLSDVGEAIPMLLTDSVLTQLAQSLTQVSLGSKRSFDEREM